MKVDPQHLVWRALFARVRAARGRRRAVLLGVVAALALSGCEALSAFKFIPLPLPDFSVTRTREIQIEVAPGANEDNPIALDVVVAYDKEMLNALLKLSAREWFKNRHQFRLDYPTGYDVWEWEVVPGQTVEPQPLSDDVMRANGSVVFANYVTEGDHRARIDQLANVLIRLGEKGFTVESVNTN